MSLTWSGIQQVYDPDAAAHRERCVALGLDCPVDVFGQIFHQDSEDAELGRVLRFVDWSLVAWEEGALSGVALRHTGVPRAYQRAVDEARQETARSGFQDDRPEVVAHLTEFHTWIRAPIVLAGALRQTTLRHELIVGFTRLGNLLGALDRQDLPEYTRHRVWIGR